MTSILVICLGCIVLLIYVIVIGRYALVLTGFPGASQSMEDFIPEKITLLVPFRNEASNLENLLKDIRAQNYSKELLEVIFINDHSTDKGAGIIEKHRGGEVDMRIIHLEDGQSGKKEAIRVGVLAALGSRVIQTDADCRLSPGFVMAHARSAAENRGALIAGPVLPARSKGLWNRLESLEFLSLAGTTTGSFMLDNPVMCNGANLSFEKEFYLENRSLLSGAKSPSGDDIFLLIMARKAGIQTLFLYSEEGRVFTSPTGSLKGFMKQRIRWGSKVKFYTNGSMIALAILVFLVNALLLGLLIAGLANPSLFYFFIITWVVKSVVDFSLLAVSASFFKLKRLLWYFPPAAIFYYFYIVVAGLLALLPGLHWKDRNYT